MLRWWKLPQKTTRGSCRCWCVKMVCVVVQALNPYHHKTHDDVMCQCGHVCCYRLQFHKCIWLDNIISLIDRIKNKYCESIDWCKNNSITASLRLRCTNIVLDLNSERLLPLSEVSIPVWTETIYEISRESSSYWMKMYNMTAAEVI